MAISQLDAMREVIQTELVPRVVTAHLPTPEQLEGFWKCEICQTKTDYDPAKAHTPLMAKHTTFCKLGNVLGVIE